MLVIFLCIIAGPVSASKYFVPDCADEISSDQFFVKDRLINVNTFYLRKNGKNPFELYNRLFLEKGWSAGGKEVRGDFVVQIWTKGDVLVILKIAAGGSERFFCSITTSFETGDMTSFFRSQQGISPYPYGENMVIRKTTGSTTQIQENRDGPKIFFPYITRQLEKSGWTESEDFKSWSGYSHEKNMSVFKKGDNRLSVTGFPGSHNKWCYVFSLGACR